MLKMQCGHEFHKKFWMVAKSRKEFYFAEPDETGEKLLRHHIPKDSMFYVSRPSQGVYHVCFSVEYDSDKDSFEARYLPFPKRDFKKCFKITPYEVRKEDTDDLWIKRFNDEHDKT